MIRDPNIIGHLPSFLQKYNAVNEIANAENPELKFLFDEVENIKNNQFIISSNVQGVRRFEKILGISGNEISPLQSRISRVLMFWNDEIPYTLENLKSKLNQVLGANTYLISVNGYHLILDMYEVSNENIKNIVEMLLYICPLNLEIFIQGTYAFVFSNTNTLKSLLFKALLFTKSINNFCIPELSFINDIDNLNFLEIELTTDTLWYLGGESTLDGTLKLNSDIITEKI